MEENDTCIDYSPSSGPPGSRSKHFDHVGDDYPERTLHTDFKGTDGGDQPKWRRFGDVYPKYEWLQRLHNEIYSVQNQDVRRAVDLRKDVKLIIDQFDFYDSTIRDWIVNDAIKLLSKVRHERDDGLQFGAGRPYELTLLGTLSIIARSYVTVSSFDDIQPDERPLHDLADGGPTLTHLRKTWVPDDTAVDVGTVRDARNAVREYMETSS